ncbi:MAG TPA: GGDEF domain-containing protein [Candidatus Sumerlaeota bacterium]|nr:GGDEF domain-containing protein [Candidatus Sumerlaeota bacterium]
MELKPPTDSQRILEQAALQDAGEGTRGRFHGILMGLQGPLRRQRFNLDKKIVTIGRDMNADILINDSKTARRHASVIYTNFERKDEMPQMRLYDCGITSGTFVNGQQVPNEGSLLHDKDRVQIGKSVFAFFLLDSEESTLDRKLEEMATRDTLTGLLNRRLFRETVDREIARAARHDRPLSLLLVDIDADSVLLANAQGRDIQEEVLRQLGEFLENFLRPADEASRNEDDTISVLLPETDGAGAEATALRVCLNLEKHAFRFGNDSFSLKLNIGVTVWDRSVDLDTFLSQAEVALKRARQNAPNGIAIWGHEPEHP